MCNCPAGLSLDDPSFVGNIQSIIVRRQSNIGLLSIRPDHGVYLSHVSVIELLHSLFNLVLGGGDLHNEHRCVFVFCFLHGWLGGEGDLDDGIVFKLFLPGRSSEDIWAVSWAAVFQAVGRWVTSGSSTFFFLVALDTFQNCFLYLQVVSAVFPLLHYPTSPSRPLGSSEDAMTKHICAFSKQVFMVWNLITYTVRPLGKLLFLKRRINMQKIHRSFKFAF